MITTNPKDEVWRIYQALWVRASELALVHYIGDTDPRMLPGEGGYFHPRDEEGAEIAIVRPHYREQPMPHPSRQEGAPMGPPDLLGELCVLVHEYGHARSWKEKHRTSEYVAATVLVEGGGKLSNTQRSAVLDEERRAWAYGRAALKDEGFNHWDTFDSCEQFAMSEHERLVNGGDEP